MKANRIKDLAKAAALAAVAFAAAAAAWAAVIGLLWACSMAGLPM